MSIPITVEDQVAERQLVNLKVLGEFMRPGQHATGKDSKVEAEVERLQKRARSNRVRLKDSVLRRVAMRKVFSREAAAKLKALREQFEASQRNSGIKTGDDHAAAIKKTTGADEGVDLATGKPKETARRIAGDPKYVDLPNPRLSPPNAQGARALAETFTRHLAMLDDKGDPVDLKVLAEQVHAALKQRKGDGQQSSQPPRIHAARGFRAAQPPSSLSTPATHGPLATPLAAAATAPLAAGFASAGASTTTPGLRSSLSTSGGGTTRSLPTGLFSSAGDDYKFGGTLADFDFGKLIAFIIRDMKVKFSARQLGKQHRYLAHLGRMAAIATQQALIDGRHRFSVAQALGDTQRRTNRETPDNLSQDFQQRLAGDKQGVMWEPEQAEFDPLMQHGAVMRGAVVSGAGMHETINGIDPKEGMAERGDLLGKDGLRDALEYTGHTCPFTKQEDGTERPIVAGYDRRCLSPGEEADLSRSTNSDAREMLKKYRSYLDTFTKTAGQASKYGMYQRESERLRAQAANVADPEEKDQLLDTAEDLEHAAAVNMVHVDALRENTESRERHFALNQDMRDFHKTYQRIKDSGEDITGSRNAAQTLTEILNRGEGIRRAWQRNLEVRDYLRDQVQGKVHRDHEVRDKSGHKTTVEVGFEPGDQVNAKDGGVVYSTLEGTAEAHTQADPKTRQDKEKNADATCKATAKEYERYQEKKVPQMVVKDVCQQLKKKIPGLQATQLEGAVGEAVKGYPKLLEDYPAGNSSGLCHKIKQALEKSLPTDMKNREATIRDVRETILQALEDNPLGKRLKLAHAAKAEFSPVSDAEKTTLRELEREYEKARRDYGTKKAQLLEENPDWTDPKYRGKLESELASVRSKRDAACRAFRNLEESVNKRLGLRGRWKMSIERLEKSTLRLREAEAGRGNLTEAKADYEKAREGYLRADGRLEEYKRMLGITEVDDVNEALKEIHQEKDGLSIARKGDGLEVNRTDSADGDGLQIRRSDGQKTDQPGLDGDDPAFATTSGNPEELLAHYEGRLEAGDLAANSYGDNTMAKLSFLERALSMTLDAAKGGADEIPAMADQSAQEVDGGQAEMRGEASRRFGDAVKESEKMRAQLLRVMHEGSMIAPR